MVAGLVEGWGVVQSRERILAAYLYLLLLQVWTAAINYKIYVSRGRLFRCLRKTYCIHYYIIIFFE